MQILHLWLLFNALAIATSAMEPKSAKKRKGENIGKEGNTLNLDLNLPAPIESEESEADVEKQRKKRRLESYAKYNVKRKERVKNDPIYAQYRQEMLRKSNKNWRLKRNANLTEEKRKELKRKRTQENHSNYLRRKEKFDGYNSKKEQEVAEIIARLRRGEEVSTEDKQKAIDHRKKKNMTSQKYKLKMRLLAAEKQNKPE